MSAKPQPTPWRVEMEQSYEPHLVDAEGEPVRGVKLWEDDAGYGSGSDLNDKPRANTKLLVDAVNAHAKQTEALAVAMRTADELQAECDASAEILERAAANLNRVTQQRDELLSAIAKSRVA